MGQFRARQRLEKGQPVVVAHPYLGSFEKARYPENTGKWYVGKEVKVEVRDNAYQALRRDHVEREGAFVSDSRQLNRFLQANGFAQGTPDLTGEEAEAASTLRKYQGGLNGVFTTVYSEDDFNDGYYFRTKPDRSDQNPGLYNPQAKEGGFLGIGARQDRLTPYEAMELLSQQQPIRIVDEGRSSTLHTFAELQAYQRLD